MEIANHYISFLVCGFTTLGCLVLLVTLSFPVKRLSWRTRLVMILSYTAVVALYAYLFQTDELFASFLSPFYYFIALPIALKLTAKGAAHTMIYTYAIFVLIQSVLGQSLLFFMEIVPNYLQTIALQNWIYSAVNLVFFAFLLYGRASPKNPRILTVLSNLPKKTAILIIANLFCVTLLEGSIININENLPFYTGFSQYLSIILLVFHVMLIVSFLAVNNSKTLSDNMVRALSKQVDIMVEHYQALKQYDDKLRQFRHDYKNQILCLRALIDAGDREQALAHIETMYDFPQAGAITVDSGNHIADALLSVKKQSAVQYGTDILFDGFIPSSGISNFDLCTILTNALDNAIEACSDMEGDKQIRIFSEIKNGFWFISIENPVKQAVKIQNNTVITTKQDPSLHGFGLHNIDLAIRRNQGSLTLTYREPLFVLEAALRLNREKLEE